MPEENPALPPDPALLNRQPKWFKKVFYGVIVASVLFIIALIGLLFAPRFLRNNKNGDEAQAQSNLKQIGLALLEFDADFGAYPSDATVAKVEKSHPAHGYDLADKSSNALFRQLLAVECTQSEDIFYARVQNAIRPDGVILPGEALKKREVAFAYISGLTSVANPSTPIALAPMIPGTTKFDPEGFGGRGNAVVLFTDYSARIYKIDSDGHIYDDKGIDLLSPKNPIWKGKKPDIRYPDL